MAVADAPAASSGATAHARTRPLPHPALTTPARLRLSAIVLVAALAVLGITGVRAALDRAAAADVVAEETTPLLVGSESLYVALAHADAAASTAFLQAGLEPPSLRARYLDDLETSGAQLAEIAAATELSDGSREAITRIAQQLPVYAGQIEAARANNRLDFPLGAAYLRRASDAMRTSMLPAATGIYDEAARRLYDAYDRGTATRNRTVLLVVTSGVLVLLLATQVMVALRSRRLLNAGLLTATLIVVALGAWALVVLDGQGRALVRSQREGADQLIVLSLARIFALRSLSDENLNLIERGTDRAYLEDFASMRTAVGGVDGSDGLLADAAALAERTGSSDAIEGIRQQWAEYLAVHDRLRRLDEAGSYRQAVELAVNDGAAAADGLDTAFDSEIAAARERLDANAADARRQLRGLTTAVVAATVAAAVLAVGGLWLRMKEYR